MISLSVLFLLDYYNSTVNVVAGHDFTEVQCDFNVFTG